jgi:hypothetical protein
VNGPRDKRIVDLPRIWFVMHRDDVVGAAILFALLVLTLAPFVIGNRTLQDSALEAASLYPSGSRPAPTESYPVLRVLDAGAPAWELEPDLLLDAHIYSREKTAPIWNPYNAYGTPLAADMQSQPFYPLAWVAMIFHGARGFDFFILLRLYTAGLLTFLFLRRFVSMVPALAGGAAFMYTGYLWIYVTMPEVSVEVIVPGLILAVEALVRRPNFNSIVLFGILFAASVVGGMPESTVLAVSWAVVYAIYRLFSVAEFRTNRLAIVRGFGFGTLLSFGLSAVAILPFAEFVRRSFNTHSLADSPPFGLNADPFSTDFLSVYLAPLIRGPVWNNIFSGFSGHSSIRGSFGTIAACLAALAIVGAIGNRLRSRTASGYPIAFFAFTILFLICKRFGFAGTSFIGLFPGFRYVQFSKYEEAELGCAVAMLAGFGLARLLDRKTNLREIALAASIPLVVLTATAGVDRDAYRALTDHANFYILSLVGALVALGAFLLAGFLANRGLVKGSVAAACLAGALVIELNANYIFPLYRSIDQSAPQEASTYELSAPYVTFLQKNLKNGERMFGEDYLLYPNWSAPFEIADVRSLNALYDERYFPFVQAFFSVHRDEELDNRFGGIVPTSFTEPLQKRFLQLSSIRYVAARHSIGDSDDVLAAILGANETLVSPTFRPGTFEIAGERKSGLFVHPPQPGVGTRIQVPPKARALHFWIGLLPDVWSGPICGDGVTFSIRAGGGTSARTIFTKYIDPKHDVAERRWIEAVAPIEHFRGRATEISISTAGGPSGTTCLDWAVFGDMRFTGDGMRSIAQLPIAYNDPSASIYEFRNPLPRLAAYGNLEHASDGPGALSRLTSSSFDPSRTVVSEDDVEGFSAGSAARTVIAGSIQTYSSRRVVGKITLPAASFVMLNDTWYPGWNAYVDGVETRTYHADYLFRGIVVPAGDHTIEFRYEPRTFAIGLLLLVVSLLAVSCIAVYLAVTQRKRVDAAGSDAG